MKASTDWSWENRIDGIVLEIEAKSIKSKKPSLDHPLKRKPRWSGRNEITRINRKYFRDQRSKSTHRPASPLRQSWSLRPPASFKYRTYFLKKTVEIKNREVTWGMHSEFLRLRTTRNMFATIGICCLKNGLWCYQIKSNKKLKLIFYYSLVGDTGLTVP